MPPRSPLGPWLLSVPLGVGALGMGFMAQGIVPRQQSLSGPMLEAMLKAPPPTARASQPSGPPTGQAADQPAGEDLRGLEAHRARNHRRGYDLAEPEAGSPVNLEIRVALLAAGASPALGATNTWRLRSRSGEVLRQGQAGDTINVAPGADLPAEVWLETAPGSALLVNGRPYGGRLRLVQQSSGLLVVNHLPLEDYIASVVGSEMPSSWDLEALKAQAVAARSYALAHMARPASAHWHLGDNTRWQAYNGLESASYRSRSAATQTSGIILSYQGGIVESLYAANSQIAAEAHGALGASMSQTGAQDLALEGLHYNQILGRYYPGASLARLKAHQG